MKPINMQLIERHLRGTLTKEEHTLFQQKMKDPAFKKQVTFMENMQTAIKVKEHQQLKAILEKEEKRCKEQEHKVVKIKRLRRTAAIAASLILLVSMYFLVSLPKSPEAFFAAHYEPKQNSHIKVERGENPNASLLNDAFILYEDGKYEEATKAFDQILKESSNNEILPYRAHALLATGKTQKAIIDLERFIKQTTDDTARSAANYTLALAYIRQGNTEKAKPHVEALRNHPFYKNKTKKLLKYLNMA